VAVLIDALPTEATPVALPAVPTHRTSTMLTGWGRTAPSRADVVEVTTGELACVVREAGSRGVLVRGLGRSYGDAAQNAGGTVVRLDVDGDDDVVVHGDGTVTAHAGVSIDHLLRVIVPQGWFVPVTPGTRFVTIGGAIASDVHGKNHHVDGSFGVHVTEMRMLLADGSVLDLTPVTDPELWWATIGGMGLTGAILRATFRVLPIESSRCIVDTLRTRDLDELLAAMTEGDHRYRYSVAWVDLLATGSNLGRSVLTRGDHAPAAAVAGGGDPLAYGPRMLAAVPPGVPNVITHTTVRAFNELWYRKAPRGREGDVQTITQFFHPLDAVARWNRVYGRHGFLQYQFVVPFGQEAALRSVVERVVRSGRASFVAVLKRFGPGNPAPLSFPTEGWTLTIDLPADLEGLGDLLRELDGYVLGAGGRHYLAKDATTTPRAIRCGYPRLAEWQAVQRRVDPHGRWNSDIARRLELIGQDH
jgi:decaprenylphospho-beta-D-ribofuranose 2-oxidase